MERQHVLLILFGSLLGYSNEQYILTKMPCVVDDLWMKVNSNWVVTTGSYMGTYFSRYDKSKASDTLSLFEREFISSDGHNFVKDFSECKMTEVFARAYFRAFNLYDSWLFLRLTIEDMDLLVDEIDSSTGNFGLGFITGAQFKNGMKERVLRGLPFHLMFVTKMNRTGRPTFRHNMKKKTFLDFHSDMDFSEDGQVVRDEMGKFWTRGKYDKAKQGRLLFEKLDYKKLGFLNITHWENLFYDLDCGDGKISNREFVQLDFILHDQRDYPLGKRCTSDDLLSRPINKQTSDYLNLIS